MVLITVKGYHDVATHHLVGLTEIAEMFGVSRQRVDEIVRSDQGFPPAEVVLKSGRVWRRETIEQWAKATGRKFRKP